MKRNLEPRTSNVQRRTLTRRNLLGCSMFPLVLAFATGPVLGQTNALPPLSPPYGELPPTFWEQHGTFVLLAGLGTIVLVVLLLWQLLRPKPIVMVPPEVQARRDLEALLQQPEDGVMLSRVSQVVRGYFIKAFQLADGELTTSEFSRELTGCKTMENHLAVAVGEFLRECDGRKFSPTPDCAAGGAARRALQLVAQAEARRVQLRQTGQTQGTTPHA